MAKVVQFRRGTTAQVLAYTGTVGELVVDTDKDVITVHDGAQAGGHPIMSSEGGVFTGNVSQTATTQATSRTTGAFVTAGGMGIAKDLWAEAIYDTERRVFTSITTTDATHLQVSQSANVCTVSPQPTGVVAATKGDGGNVPIITVDSKGYITVFTSTPGGAQIAITDESTVNANRYIAFSPQTSGSISQVNADTSLYYNPSTNFLYAGNYQATSDEEHKSNIVSITGALEKVLNLRGVSFTYKENDVESIGVVAQEVEKVLPELVDDFAGHKTVNYEGLIPVICAAIQEQQSQLAELKVKLG